MHLILPLTPPLLALGVLGAHFYRAAAWPMVLACVVLIVLLLALPRPWVARLVQACLLAGAAEWVWTAAMLVQQRTALGAPWQRMAVILGVVAVATAAAALVFRTAALRRRHGLGVAA